MGFDSTKLSRNSDPQTSHDAASSIETLTARHKKIVLETLQPYPHGLTPAEVSDRCSLDHSQVWRRMSDLKNDGVIEECGKRKQPSGREARVMRIAVKQLELI